MTKENRTAQIFACRFGQAVSRIESQLQDPEMPGAHLRVFGERLAISLVDYFQKEYDEKAFKVQMERGSGVPGWFIVTVRLLEES